MEPVERKVFSVRGCRIQFYENLLKTPNLCKKILTTTETMISLKVIKKVVEVSEISLIYENILFV